MKPSPTALRGVFCTVGDKCKTHSHPFRCKSRSKYRGPRSSSARTIRDHGSNTAPKNCLRSVALWAWWSYRQNFGSGATLSSRQIAKVTVNFELVSTTQHDRMACTHGEVEAVAGGRPEMHSGHIVSNSDQRRVIHSWRGNTSWSATVRAC